MYNTKVIAHDSPSQSTTTEFHLSDWMIAVDIGENHLWREWFSKIVRYWKWWRWRRRGWSVTEPLQLLSVHGPIELENKGTWRKAVDWIFFEWNKSWCGESTIHQIQVVCGCLRPQPKARHSTTGQPKVNPWGPSTNRLAHVWKLSGVVCCMLACCLLQADNVNNYVYYLLLNYV